MDRRPPRSDEPRRSPGPLTVAALAGSAWGLVGYLALWGYTPVQPSRRFVVSPLGTALLLPVRAVLATIRFVEERVVHRTFQLAENNAWIGVVAAVIGALLVVAIVAVARIAVRRVRARPVT